MLTARLQSRIGPPLLQPLYDVLKLFGKESLVVNAWQSFCAYAYLTAAAVATVMFFVRSDLLVIFLIQAVGTVFLVVGALAATSPFSQIGGYRELLQALACEPLLVLVISGIYLATGSFNISAVCRRAEPVLFETPLLFLCLLLVMTVKLRKSPFDFAAGRHAHQELVGGLLTDYSGPFLALIEIGHWFETILLLGICSLFWAPAWPVAAMLAAAAYLGTIWIDNVTARMNWRWMFGYAWLLGLPLALINLFWLNAE
jgi:ech hydrogenase subunit B